MLRLLPLYLLALAAMFVIVMVISNGVLVDTPSAMLNGLIRWLSFTMLGDPDLNGVEGTRRILAGVTWSLPYERFFYLCLPILALAVLSLPPLVALLIGVAGLLAALVWGPDSKFLVDFFGGITAALMVRSERAREALK